MNPTAPLRTQLTERKPAPATTGSPGTAENTRCLRTSEGARGVTIDTGDVIASFPYSHYLYALLTSGNSVTIRFATHRVVATGRNLEILLEELTGQRLVLLRALPKRMQELAEPRDVWIERIDITEARATSDKPGS